jgi:hypothetical protein
MGDAQRVPVLDQSRHGRIWLLSVDGRDAVLAQTPMICRGFGMPYPKPFSAVFLHDDRIWLQVGAERWDVLRIQRVQQTQETARIARYDIHMVDGSVSSVEIRFPLDVVAHRHLDPTHDEIDSWSEDIMKALPYTAADGWTADPQTDVAAWVARVRPLWRSGLPPRGTAPSDRS